MILHIPHSGIDGHDLTEEMILVTDWYTDELFFHENSDRLVQNVSRIICDCERLPEEITHYDEHAKQIYDEHHTKLNKLTSKMLCYIPTVFVVDCHSFNDFQRKSDVDFCLGFNHDFTDFDLIKQLTAYIESEGYKVGVNDPYRNAIVPSQYYNNKNVKSIMIEVHKRNYLKSHMGNIKSENFDKLATVINNVLDIISQKELSYDNI